MFVSKFLLIVSMLSIGLVAACSGPGTYPFSGDQVSTTDPVQDMDMPGYIFRGESR